MNIVNAAEKTFEQLVLRQEKPVLVDFFAHWCGDCRRIDPLLNVIADKHAALFSVIKVNTDTEPVLAKKYGVMALPTLRLFCKGKPGPSLVEPSSKAEIDEWLKSQGVV